MRTLRVAVFVAGVALLAGCGGGAAPAVSGSHAPGSATATAAATAGTPENSIRVTLDPVMYPPGSACAAVTTNTLMGALPAPCAFVWSSDDVTSIPSPSLMADSPIPQVAAIAPGVPLTQGTADATAFYRWVVLSAWAETEDHPQILSVLDGPYATQDPVLKLLNAQDTIPAGGYPSCAYPNAISVQPMTAAADLYLGQLGWSSTATTAVVATYPACTGGIEIATATGPVHIAASTVPFSQIITGGINTTPAFGDLWDLSGYATCGAAALKSVCAG